MSFCDPMVVGDASVCDVYHPWYCFLLERTH
jgi:hypothetical protein